ncbi:MAG: GTA-gp10 family protein [Rhodobacter sp.]|nr:GTA-gp10 family protein [Rhodobacter sp.]
MGIAIEAPRGGVVEAFGGKPYRLRLRLGEIERFEDRHRGIFDTLFGFEGEARAPTSREVRDLCALGLVGGGDVDDREADRIIAAEGPAGLMKMYEVAKALIGVAFHPDWDDEDSRGGDAQGKTGGAETGGSTSAPSSAPQPPATTAPTISET